MSADGGSTWINTQWYNPTTQQSTPTITAPGTYLINGTGGMSHARVLCSGYTSGTVSGVLRASAQADDVVTANFAPTGQATKASSISVALATDAFAGIDTTSQFPAGGTGPVWPVPVKSDIQFQQLATIIEMLRDIHAALTAALSP